jgi:hypothetical protein
MEEQRVFIDGNGNIRVETDNAVITNISDCVRSKIQGNFIIDSASVMRLLRNSGKFNVRDSYSGWYDYAMSDKEALKQLIDALKDMNDRYRQEIETLKTLHEKASCDAKKDYEEQLSEAYGRIDNLQRRNFWQRLFNLEN